MSRLSLSTRLMVRALAGGAVALVEVDEGLLSSLPDARGVRGRAERGVVGPTERGNPGSQEPGLPDLFDLTNASVTFIFGSTGQNNIKRSWI